MSLKKAIRYLTVKELAERWRVSLPYIYNRLSAGTFVIKPFRIGRLVRFRIEDVEKYERS